MKCAPRKGDVYNMPLQIKQTYINGNSCLYFNYLSHSVRMRTDEARACFDAYKIGTVTEGLDALRLIPLPFGPKKKAEANAVAAIKVVCPLYDFLVSALTRPTATADELYALYSATPRPGPDDPRAVPPGAHILLGFRRRLWRPSGVVCENQSSTRSRSGRPKDGLSVIYIEDFFFSSIKFYKRQTNKAPCSFWYS